MTSVQLQLKSNRLMVEWGFPDERQQENFSRSNLPFSHLLIIGKGGNLSLEALNWLTSSGVAVSFLDYFGNLTSSLLPEKPVSAWVKRRQATLTEEEKTILTKWLLEKKLKAQSRTLTSLLNRQSEKWFKDHQFKIQQGLKTVKERSQVLIWAKNPDACRVLEMQAASAYWQSFEGIPIAFLSQKVSESWRAITPRTSTLSGTPRKAVNPFHACLNYLYSVLSTQTKIACLKANLDPELGILHVDKTIRDSLVYDLMEPFRPKCDLLLLEWFLKRTFSKDSFFETREGICKVSQKLTPEIVKLVDVLTPELTRFVMEFARMLKKEIMGDKQAVVMGTRAGKEINSAAAEVLEPFIYERPNVTVIEAERVEKKPASCNKVNPAAKATAKTGVGKIEDLRGKIKDNPFCLECGEKFTRTHPRQNFCSKRCRETYKKRLMRQRRREAGCCPQCGKPMPEGAKGTYKEKLTYCSDCAEYWKRRYERRKVFIAQ
jgi:CRISPR-associated endonuclease Cas1